MNRKPPPADTSLEDLEFSDYGRERSCAYGLVVASGILVLWGLVVAAIVYVVWQEITG